MQPDLMSASRRDFLKVTALAGGGLALTATMPGLAATAGATATELSVYVTIASSGDITIVARNPEMGQGVKTSLPMIIAEELDADWSRVKVVMADADTPRYGLQMSVGSISTPTQWLPMRRAGAVVRQMLVTTAAQRANVPVSELSTQAGRVLHKASGRTWSYGELAADAAKLTPPDVASVPLKDPKDFRIVGSRQRGVDSAKVLKGEPLFGIDTHLPGQLHAVFESAPAHGGKLLRADIAAAEAAPGVVKVIVLSGKGGPDALVDGVAVVATNHWYAERARGLLKLEWDLSAAKDHSTATYAGKAKALIEAGKGSDIRRDGDAAAALQGAARRVAATYGYPFLAHATLEPQNCTALLHEDGQLEIWAPSQGPAWGMDLIAKHLGIPTSKQKVHITRCGGGFGRRGGNDYMVQAAAIAQAMPGKPVQLLWSRADDLKRDFYRPGAWHHFEAGLDPAGKLAALTCHYVSFGKGGEMWQTAKMGPLSFPAGLVGNVTYQQDVIDTVLPMGFLRAPGSNGQAFAIQAFLDEVAEAAGKDLPGLMLELCAEDKVIGNPGDPTRASSAFRTARARKVIERVLADSGWAKRPREKGRGFGFAFYFCHMGYFAEVVEASVAGASVQVHKVWVAGDVGSQIVNPMGAEAQVRGSVIEGLQMALGQQEMTFVDGAPEQHNFDGYSPARMSMAPPEIAISFVKSDYPPSGLGEPALPPVIPALANAIHAATGRRVRSLPMRLEA